MQRVVFGVVSPLDAQDAAWIRDLRDELGQRLGPGVATTALVPHVSYHVAERYDVDRLDGDLARLAKTTAAFSISLNAAAVFPGAGLLLYYRVVPTPELRRLHDGVWRAVTPCGTGGSAYYVADAWVPHVSLTRAELREDQVPVALALAASYGLPRTCRLTQLVLGQDDGRAQIALKEHLFEG